MIDNGEKEESYNKKKTTSKKEKINIKSTHLTNADSDANSNKSGLFPKTPDLKYLAG